MMVPNLSDSCDWIFFDCFNTLIDDFDREGEEHGLGSLPDIAVQHGFFTRRQEFVLKYIEQRSAALVAGAETLFAERLRRTLQAGAPNASQSVEQGLAAMLEVWEDEYHRNLRPTTGVREMLEYWSARKPLGVISNFFLPHYPERYLERFGLRNYVKFVVDSAAFGYKKPHHKIFQRAFELADVSGDQVHRVAFVGDRIDLDITPALELGMRAIHFNRSQDRQNVTATPPGVEGIFALEQLR